MTEPSVVIVLVAEVSRKHYSQELTASGIKVLAVGETQEEILPLLAQYKPDMLLVNLSFFTPTKHQIKREFPDVKVVVMTAGGASPFYINHIIEKGFLRAYVDLLDLKDGHDVVTAVKMVARNEMYWSTAAQEAMKLKDKW